MPRGIPNQPAAPAIFICRETFAGQHDGAPLTCHKGVTRVAAGHPLLDVYGVYFEPVSRDVHFGAPTGEVEQATAAPGERRGVPPAPAPPALDPVKADPPKTGGLTTANTPTK